MDLGGLWATFLANPIVQFSVRFVGLFFLALYLSSIYWTVRDAQRRIENPLVPYLAGLFAAVVPFLGVFVYLILRPSETLSEAYERQLAEESLLSEAETRIVCPTCHERVQDDWLLCPSCRTRLKRVCPSCAKLIRPEWNICPFCAKDFDERDYTVHAIPGGRGASS